MATRKHDVKKKRVRTKAADKYAAFEARRSRVESEYKSGERSVLETGRSLWAVAKSMRSTRKAFDSPEHLLNAAYDYFAWSDANPDYEYKPMAISLPGKNSGSEIRMVKVPKKQPYTMRELSVFIGVSPGWMKALKNRNDYDKWLPAVREIQGIINSQQFNGAASGFFNARLMAMALHMKEKIESKIVDDRKAVADLFPQELKPKKKKE